MKRNNIILAAVLSLTAVFSLCGCYYSVAPVTESSQSEGKEPEETVEAAEEKADDVISEAANDEEDTSAEQQAADASEEAAVQETEAEAKEEASADIELPEVPAFEIPDCERKAMFELVADMGAGFNMGNSFDSTGNKTVACETHWGNPKITPEMINAIADKGFKTIRIPVSWGDHTGPAPDYLIDEAWMDRVQEVIDYACATDMYIIINTHHEEDTWLNTDPANKDVVKAQLVATWEQIADRFKDYDHRLLFEGMNEPRLKGSSNEWNGGKKEEREVVNELNQAFVDTVRASGGKNADRPLLICPYANSAVPGALQALAIPDDVNIIVAVHAYAPYAFTYDDPNASSYPTWNGIKKTEIVSTFTPIRANLIDKGVPVLLDEMGAQNKDNREDIDKWLMDYISVAGRYGIKCVWWDNGNFDGPGEKFAIFNRRDLSWYADSTADIFVKMQNYYIVH